jgi:hypothetical protein
MQKICTLILVLCFPVLLLAQTRKQNSFSATVSGGFTDSYIKQTKVGNLAGNETTGRFTAGIHAWYNKTLGNKWDLQTGIGYTDFGFRRQQPDAKLMDHTYPGLGSGMILDASNVRKNINYDYRFHYIQIPLWFNYDLGRTKDFKTNFSLTMGAALDVLVKHHMTARLDKFTVDEEKKFQFDSTGLKASPVNMNVNLGFKVEHKMDKTTTLIVQPMFNLFPFSTTTEDIKVRPYAVMLHIGLVLNLSGSGDKE